MAVTDDDALKDALAGLLATVNSTNGTASSSTEDKSRHPVYDSDSDEKCAAKRRKFYFFCRFWELFFSGKTKPISLNETNNIENRDSGKVGF